MEKRTKATLILALVVGLCLGAFFYFQVQPTTAASPHRVYADPIWQITQPGTDRIVEWVDAANPRFCIYDSGTPEDETDDAVLDKETGLMWERIPYNTTTIDWYDATTHCYETELANRKGWRLPTIEELLSLVDPTQTNPALPSGHPFAKPTNPSNRVYWASTTAVHKTTEARCMQIYNGNPLYYPKSSANYSVWCVRGGNGYASWDW